MLRLLWTLLLSASAVSAEIHPRFYADMQRSAPEFLSLLVEEVEPAVLPKDEYVASRVRAKVERVFRSKSRIKKGATVEIRYTIWQPPRDYTGGRPLPHLKAGERPVFYGKVVERTQDGLWILEPVAGGRSFDTVTKEEINY
ncbi:MAG: hypothetical protein OHK0011_26350 [Turneriella sp.]